MNTTLGYSSQIRWVIGVIGVITLLEIANMLTARQFNGVMANLPRHLNYLSGILTSPFVHGSFFHYISNIFPLAVFTFLTLQYGTKIYIKASITIMLLCGLLVWLIGREALHIGASGMVYGYFGFLCLAGFLSRRFVLMLISVGVIFFYSGLVWGVLPISSYISWESHLFGFIAGLVAAKMWVKKPSDNRE